jgi:hypothetical protein
MIGVENTILEFMATGSKFDSLLCWGENLKKLTGAALHLANRSIYKFLKNAGSVS